MSNSGGGWPVGGPDSGLPAGTSLVELSIAMGIVSLCAAMSAPVLAGAADAGHAREAAQYLASECRSARMQALTQGRTSSLVFDQQGGQWLVRRCVDGNGNGMRRAEITSGRDSCEDAVDLSSLFVGVHLDVPTGLPDPDGGAATTSAVRFGTSDIASFTPAGTATAGTVYLRSQAGAQYAIRVAGVTGRTRTLRFEPASGRWREV